MDKFSYLGNADISVIEKQYQQYLENPESVEETWRKFFEGFEFARRNFQSSSSMVFDKEFKVISLIDGYRQRGHFFTKTNPVRTRRQYSPTLDIENFGLSQADLGTVFQAGKQIGIGAATLKDIVAHLEQTYCTSVGAEFVYIRTPEVVSWLREKMESSKNTPSFTPEEKKLIYFHLKLAVGFENFIHRKFVGQKRFSLEGAESLIPALEAVINKGGDLGIEEFIIGMSHRGRLNVLANILQKPYEHIFDEFNGKSYPDEKALGDVKYHLGYENEVTTPSGKKVKLSLAPNPSHLEAVDPVVLGISHAKIRNKYKKDQNKLAPILIHGDAAIAAQGVVYEIIQMSQLNGYGTGGTIHLVINNQVGFTTNYLDARSSTYCTDIAKVTRSPVFHVNGDDVEALVYTIRLAMEFRQTFHRDVFIDILCYRRYGHNEGDEPRFTQPLLYRKINVHPNPRDIYSKELIEEGIYSQEEVKQVEKDYIEILESKLSLSNSNAVVKIEQFMKNDWKGIRYSKPEDFDKSPDTSVEKELLQFISEKVNNLPPDKKFFSKIERILDDRKKLIKENKIDWAMGEIFAYGSLLLEGHPVRISGQDSERGTFAHRHAAYTLEDVDEKYFPLKNLDSKQAKFHVFNSLLSEYGVMGFEYGYALAIPNGLTIWEAQFGDFHNVAQVIVDQFISSAEEKWGLMNGLVLFLPHGYEGQGPEHSSARLERFMTLAANNNMQVVNCTTPANFFHVLRRQLKRPFRIPLIALTPKSLLRHPGCVSRIEEFTKGGFQEVIDDESAKTDEVLQVVFTSGRLYYDLIAKKEELEAHDTAIVRIEQLYPFPIEQLRAIIKKYKKSQRYVWVQDEPENMGAWPFIHMNFKDVKLMPIARPASGSPAGGLLELHNKRLTKILSKVYKQCDCELSRKYCGMRCSKFSMSEMNQELQK
jgi:2-oxoglutarate dehydrogenase E1 component